MLLILICLFYIIYYYHYVIETPSVYYSKKMLTIYNNMESLKNPIYWAFGLHNSYIQYLIYLLNCKIDTRIGKKLYKKNILKTKDGEDLLLGIGQVDYKVNGILLIFHTVFGDYCDSAKEIKKLCKNLNLMPISYSRRGHDKELTQSQFNSVGNLNDLELILDYINSNYSTLPIYGLGMSAGTSLLARYLGNKKEKSRIELGILLSPGFHFKRSQKLFNNYIKKYLVDKAKKYWLIPNKDILCKNEKDIQYYNLLLNAETMKEWHKYQWYFIQGVSNEKEYYRLFDPIYVLQYIKVPILYINSEDDIVFGKELISKYRNIINTTESTILVQTKYGGHLGFYDYKFNNWAFKISSEFIESYKKNKYYSESLELEQL